jgi:drug/metabolite transporter (DMT)-like permease
VGSRDPRNRRPPDRGSGNVPVLIGSTLLLFGVWSNSFIAISYLLGRDGAAARFDWVGLTVARFLVAGALCAVYCFVFRPAESIAVLRAEWPRLLACGFFAVPGYNLALYYGQQHGVPAPIASLTTTLVPLFVMLLAAFFLRERLTSRRVIGFAAAAVGMVVISLANKGGVEMRYPVLIAITALAPLSWSIYSVVSKPVTGRVSPVVLTYLATTIGALMMMPMLPGSTWRQWSTLDAAGWAALLYLAIPCTVMGFAVWTWLLRHLPASTVGFSVFLNPPLTTTSKYIHAALFPATFAFTIVPQEWVGGVLALVGMGIAVYVPRRLPR